MRTTKEKGVFSEAFRFFLEKRGHLVRLSVLVQKLATINPSFQTNIEYISRGGHLLVKMWAIQ